MKKYYFYFITYLACAILLSVSCSQEKEKSPSVSADDAANNLEFERTVAFLKEKSSPDTVAIIQAAVADKKSEHSEGLMNVTQLPPDNGMLFIFDTQEPRSFWMANTPLPLDIIFVNGEKQIVRIHHSAQPFSEKQYPSDDPARYVIETNGGFCVNNDIYEGMYVSF
jgi:uncharacterized membrane protein (UPF0127 family)